MKNEDKFTTFIERGIPLRDEIDNVHGKEMKALRKMFVNAFSMPGKDFTTLKDMLYYKGGWPKPESPPRMENIFSRLAVIVKYCTFLGLEEEFEKYCTLFGLNVSAVGDPANYFECIGFEDEEEFNILWQGVFGTAVPGMKRDILEKLVNYGMVLQSDICQLADKIKLEVGAEVQEECGIRPPTFNQVVTLKMKKNKGGNVDDRVHALIEKNESDAEAIGTV